MYQMVQSQYIMGMSGPVDINLSAIDIAMEHYLIQDVRMCRQMVMVAARHMISKYHEDAKMSQKKK